ncbi:hypothetical protein [Ectropis obliqua nucleopolyhedrovirus]|uniref:Putative 18.9 kDa protein n=1 Tax=Ectropis obliqua nucleopolyhedrovirus TaxID=59376 RepID=A0EYU5_9ABAC|nr:hypothetical protein EONV_gp042 [Ectropis obliqua nucleopolyhedrovirus]ABI35726.1 hypothetical protein [Ectropis obliqua nucleopolyhedrovirus]AGS47900.1 putative 18.9 kDa protein [Ectropis obliqua nucleopolyhedrovirus]QWV59689.1 hypothetical protein EONV_gp042 [Ectropis obliqua nucleopolyhedrovirus]UYO72840.1 hypothetical protein EONV-gp042 [Ectropis obliqua nucleopolyhedrovirus]
MTTMNVKFLEFGGVCLDLRHVTFPRNECEEGNSEYIVFINVYKAFYSNFKFVCNYSLETLAVFIYENVKYTIDGVQQMFESVNYSQFVMNEHDFNKSLFIEFTENARLVVAQVIKFDEQYHQRVSGYIDFENRHLQPKKIMTKEERLEYDKQCEIKLLEYT